MILLVKEVNEILTKSGLPDLTVTRNDAGTLSIAGRKCGKPVLQIPMLYVSKKITVVEREIIIDDYLQPILTKHLAELITLIDLTQDTRAKDIFDKLVESEKVDGYRHASYSTPSYMIPDTIADIRSYDTKLISDTNNVIKLVKLVDKNNAAVEINIKELEISDIAKKMNAAVKLLADMSKRQAKYVKAYEAKVRHDEKVTEAAAKLITVCEF